MFKLKKELGIKELKGSKQCEKREAAVKKIVREVKEAQKAAARLVEGWYGAASKEVGRRARLQLAAADPLAMAAGSSAVFCSAAGGGADRAVPCKPCA